MFKTILLSAMALIAPMYAHALELSGDKIQGGLVYGNTVPGATVYWEGEDDLPEAKVDEQGRFVIGIHRLQKENSTLVINLMDGIEEKHPVQITQRDYNTQYIKGVKKKHVTPDPENMKRIKADSAQIYKARAHTSDLDAIFGKFIQPTEGRITGVYGSRRFYNGEERNWHKGLDLANKTGTPIVAPAPGTVRLSLPDSFFNGNLVILDHGYNMMTIYAHMDSLKVSDGQQVQAGDILGTVGSTGRSTGPHLHWGLYWRNIALDPQLLLE